ncbi:MAG: hypothetical protein HQ579_05710 [Candidatus Omnitrophica bacterium]|nr:hypothetical protein [Candidatus Omnitrophota bacterium]
MNIQEMWEKALHKTEIVRPSIQGLKTFRETNMPYVFLGESSVNQGDTVIRKGMLVVEKPSILLPPNSPQFEGFEFEKDMKVGKDMLTNFLFVRGIRFPSFKYNNMTSVLDIYEGSLKKAIKHYSNILEREENTDTGLMVGPEDCWQFSVLIFICSQVIKSAPNDIKRMLEEF